MTAKEKLLEVQKKHEIAKEMLALELGKDKTLSTEELNAEVQRLGDEIIKLTPEVETEEKETKEEKMAAEIAAAKEAEEEKKKAADEMKLNLEQRKEKMTSARDRWNGSGI